MCIQLNFHALDICKIVYKPQNDDVSKVNKSAKKITSRFEKIERVELESEGVDKLESDE